MSKPATKSAAKPATKAKAAPATQATVDADVTEDDAPALTPSQLIDAEQEAAELRAELLADLPALRPAHRFRLAHRNAFHNLTLEAMKSGTFDRDALEFDLSKPEDIEAFQRLQSFSESIDAWAESIAEDTDDYARWSEGKTEEHMIALYVTYQEALGE